MNSENSINPNYSYFSTGGGQGGMIGGGGSWNPPNYVPQTGIQTSPYVTTTTVSNPFTPVISEECEECGVVLTAEDSTKVIQLMDRHKELHLMQSLHRNIADRMDQVLVMMMKLINKMDRVMDENSR